MINVPNIEIKKVDSKGRVILPNKDLKKVFITEYNEVIIVSKSEDKIKRTIESIQEHNKKLKLVKLKEWEKMLKEADLLKITSEDIDNAVLKTQQKKLESIMEDEDGY